MRRAAVALAAVLLCCGCAGDDPPDRLELEFTVGLRAPSTVETVLECGEAARLCGAVTARRGELLPPPPESLCIGGLPFVTLHVAGRLDGEAVDRSFGNCEQGIARRWVALLEATMVEIHVASSGRERTLLLACSPTGGTVADPAASCRALDRDGRLFPELRRTACGAAESVGGVAVFGYLRGSGLDRTFLDCREPETVQAWIELLLGYHVPPPR